MRRFFHSSHLHNRIVARMLSFHSSPLQSTPAHSREARVTSYDEHSWQAGGVSTKYDVKPYRKSTFGKI